MDASRRGRRRRFFLETDTDIEDDIVDTVSNDINKSNNFAVYVLGSKFENTHDIEGLKRWNKLNVYLEKSTEEIRNTLENLPAVICDSLTKAHAERIVGILREVKILAFVVEIGDNGGVIAEEYKSNEEFENVCMDLIEWIVSLDEKQTRAEAINIMKGILATIKNKAPSNIINVSERVLHEFQIATDKEYELLRKQLFSGRK